MRKSFIAISLSTLILAGCGGGGGSSDANSTTLTTDENVSETSSEQTTPSENTMEIPENYKELIKTEIGKKLLDPYSAQYEFEEPKKWTIPKNTGMLILEQTGDMVCGTVNAKNKFGAYVGKEKFLAMFDERVSKATNTRLLTQTILCKFDDYSCKLYVSRNCNLVKENKASEESISLF